MLTRDKAKGIGLAVMIWLLMTISFRRYIIVSDVSVFDYPIEKPMVVLSCVQSCWSNCIVILLQLDVSAMLGYTGAIFKNFSGAEFGSLVSFFLFYYFDYRSFYCLSKTL